MVRVSRAMNRFAFGILGPLAVQRDSKAIDIASRKQRLLLLLLLTRARQVVPVDQIVDALWGDSAPDKAKAALQFHVSRLRDALEPDRPKGSEGSVVLTLSPGYLADFPESWLDSRQFEDDVRRAQATQAADPATARNILSDALSLWRGPALVDAAYEEFAQPHIRRLDELRMTARESLIECELALGHHTEVTAELEKLVADHPLRERLVAHLMVALYRGGRQADALAAYRTTQAALITELGIEPSPELQQLESDILLQSPQLEHASSPALQLAQHNLPERVASFVGRSGDIEAGLRLMADSRLVTLTGPGGVGKTSLAIEVARRVAPDLTHGVWLVDLAPVEDESAVASAVGAVLGVGEHTGPDAVRSLTQILRTRRALVILDNIEHVIEGAASLAESLLAGAPQLRILATGRERMGLPGESVWLLGGLDWPEAEAVDAEDPDDLLAYDAVRLFDTRARAAGQASRSTKTRWASSWRSAAGSMASRSPSNWPPRSWTPWVWASCWSHSRTCSVCSTDHVRSGTVTGACRLPSSGAMARCRARSSRCSIGSRRSQRRLIRTPRPRLLRRAWSRAPSPRSCAAWSRCRC